MSVVRTTEPTRERILAAAEELVATHASTGSASAKSHACPGESNVGLQHHFKDRYGVVRSRMPRSDRPPVRAQPSDDRHDARACALAGRLRLRHRERVT
jgi:hypothetical protein